MKSREIHLIKRPQGAPTEDIFDLVETSLPDVKDGQILVKNDWLSVDPYMRGRMNEGKSYVPPFELGEPLEGGCVGTVVSSNHPDFSEGDCVQGNKGWREYWLSDGEQIQKIDTDLAEPQNYLSVLGLTGMTAWVGLNKIGSLQDGETVFVSAASGAVGSIVCQIAKAKGCRVIGSAGSPEKIEWLKSEAKIDDAFNYHDVDDVSARLDDFAEDGIDVYFDNVGGDHLEGAIDQMSNFGRIVCCGMISGYNDENPKPGPKNLFKLIGKRVKMEGFIVRDHQETAAEFQKEMGRLIQDGKIVWEETVTEGIEHTPNAFIDLFGGDKMGKALVHLS